MMQSRERLISALAIPLMRNWPGLTFYTVGSFGKCQYRHEEFDFVLLVDDEAEHDLIGVASQIHILSTALPEANALHICNSFIPRSYEVPLTLHCAIYTKNELLTRRPRLIRALVNQRPTAGASTWLSELQLIRWNVADLRLERWGMNHILQILEEGSWSVPLWTFYESSLQLDSRLLDLNNPHIYLEFLWYSASKLTSNLHTHAEEMGTLSSMDRCVALLIPIQNVVQAIRNGAAPEPYRASAAAAWQTWLMEYNCLLERFSSQST